MSRKKKRVGKKRKGGDGSLRRAVISYIKRHDKPQAADWREYQAFCAESNHHHFKVSRCYFLNLKCELGYGAKGKNAKQYRKAMLKRQEEKQPAMRRARPGVNERPRGTSSKTQAVAEFLKGSPHGTHGDFVEATGEQICYEYFNSIKSRLGYGKRGKRSSQYQPELEQELLNPEPREGAAGEAAREYLERNPAALRRQFEAHTGHSVSAAYWKAIQAKMGLGGVGKHSRQYGGRPGAKAASDAVVDENNYLRWAVLGNRKGWIDRLLNEIERDLI